MDFDKMPFYMFHSIYYEWHLYQEMKKKQEEEEKKKNQGKPPNKQTPSIPMEGLSEMIEQMEDEL